MNKNIKRFLFSGLALSILLFLSGCVQQKNGVPTGEGWVYRFLVEPMGEVIKYFANDMGLGFGLAIIIATIIVRLVIILPLGLYQSWNATYQSEKRAYLQPILGPIQERMQNASSQEEKMAAQTEFMAAQKENGVSMLGGIGCLPIIIQMPFFSALFYAARFTEGVSESHFLWFKLSDSNLILTAIIASLYFFQSWLSMRAVPEEQQKQMKTMMYSTPIMMIFFTISQPSGVALYWLVGGIFSIIQQLIVMTVLKPKLREKVAEEFKNNPPKAPKTNPQTRKDVTPKKEEAITSPISKPKKTNRNLGKQKRQ
ncbi:membrane protein insertase YidC [Streptococcus zalophi]|uniref:Membrane protein insertase YidC n=1 Tax=Streptococcus zalophi TaxID=640031 RepID=A0A934UDF6_9STRE|nr:membrane protein insertase YidC [Streptococcus zalophi]MBJ8349755.1 membrane protein insertase YidC [Streptococcus zalophi]MCR8967899.1 membrane protein insertase YidC [Streptococcus zalophi]